MAVGITEKFWSAAVPQLPLTAAASSNVAVTLFAASIVTWQVPVPLHAPDQPAKVLPLSGIAVRLKMTPDW